MYYTYIIRSIEHPEKIYVGWTKDLKKRVSKHNGGGSSYTAKYKPWKLLYYSAFISREKAYKFEKYLKSSSGKAFLRKRLI
jgi:predicted GIY-YIG superfamily endonuclease